jgi:hypothetical protein
MNADHIIVVASGEVTEQGSHEDLIRAGGKYAELWSKQIFVNPKRKALSDNKSGAKNPKAPNIFNDLTPDMTHSELAKVNSAPNMLSASAMPDRKEMSKDEHNTTQMSQAKTLSGQREKYIQSRQCPIIP